MVNRSEKSMEAATIGYLILRRTKTFFFFNLIFMSQTGNVDLTLSQVSRNDMIGLTSLLLKGREK